MVRNLTRLLGPAWLALSLTACSSAPEERLNVYLRAVAGGESDRGWHYLAESTREAGYNNDKAAYLADATPPIGRPFNGHSPPFTCPTMASRSSPSVCNLHPHPSQRF